MTNETKHPKDHKRFRTIEAILQSCLICILIVLVAFMMIQINNLQGTARVINYAGLVRGATQRLIKLEVTKHPNDELSAYLDEVLTDLKYGEGTYELVSLPDQPYQDKLDQLITYWENLKLQIQQIRSDNYESDSTKQLLDMSEVYFKLADETVSAAEVYSDKIAKRIKVIEWISTVDMCILLCIIVEQSFSAMQMRRRNTLLAQKAYIDTHTGLQSKNRCEELLNDTDCLTLPTACLMFDINNLKYTNDTYGHLTGDRLIADFARILKSVVRKTDFAGRCGGDEFMVIVYDIEKDSVERITTELHNEIEAFNKKGTNVPISYAQGWAISTGHDCTLRSLFDAADHCMYTNKRKMKEEAAANTAKNKADQTDTTVPKETK